MVRSQARNDFEELGKDAWPPISSDTYPRIHEEDAIEVATGGEGALGWFANFLVRGDGALFCLWRTEDGRFPVVFMPGNGVRPFILARDSLEFLRFLAIGYEDLWTKDHGIDLHGGPPSYSEPPESEVQVNPEFRNWVSDTFNVSIPQTGKATIEQARAEFPEWQTWFDEHSDL